MTITVEVLEGRANAEQLRDPWLELLPKDRWDLFMHPDWCAALWSTIDAKAHVRFHVAHADGRIVGILPVSRRRMNRFVLFLPLGESFAGLRGDYTGLVVAATLGFEKAIEYPETIASRFEKQERCFAFEADGALAHVAWLTFGYLPLSRAVDPLAFSGAAGIYDCFTIPAHLGRGVYRAALDELCRVAKAEGHGEVQICVEPTNLASPRVIERVGFKRQSLAVINRRFGTRKVISRGPE